MFAISYDENWLKLMSAFFNAQGIENIIEYKHYNIHTDSAWSCAERIKPASANDSEMLDLLLNQLLDFELMDGCIAFVDMIEEVGRAYYAFNVDYWKDLAQQVNVLGWFDYYAKNCEVVVLVLGDSTPSSGYGVLDYISKEQLENFKEHGEY